MAVFEDARERFNRAMGIEYVTVDDRIQQALGLPRSERVQLDSVKE
jgi:hypothetical protein